MGVNEGGGRLDVLREHTTGNLRYICVLDGFSGCGGITYRLHPDGRLYTLYLRHVALFMW